MGVLVICDDPVSDARSSEVGRVIIRWERLRERRRSGDRCGVYVNRDLCGQCGGSESRPRGEPGAG